MENKLQIYISAEAVIQVLLNTKDPFQTHNGLYLWELSKLVEYKYNPLDFVITNITPGLSDRDPINIENIYYKSSIAKAIDLYCIELSRKPNQSSHGNF